MAGITVEIANARLTAYLDAEAKILKGQRVDLDGQALTRADLAAVQRGIELWQGKVSQLTGAGKVQVRRVVPV